MQLMAPVYVVYNGDDHSEKSFSTTGTLCSTAIAAVMSKGDKMLRARRGIHIQAAHFEGNGLAERSFT